MCKTESTNFSLGNRSEMEKENKITQLSWFPSNKSYSDGFSSTKPVLGVGGVSSENRN